MGPGFRRGDAWEIDSTILCHAVTSARPDPKAARQASGGPVDQLAKRTELPERVKRHRLSTRIWHWINALTVFVMLMSGLMIFNAHPRLYWGEYGANADRAWLEIGSTERDGLSPDRVGCRIADHRRARPLDRSRTATSSAAPSRTGRRSPPPTASPPARRWHLAFAWMLAIGLIAYCAHQPRSTATPGATSRRAAPNCGPRHVWHDIKAACPAALPHRRGGARATTSSRS